MKKLNRKGFILVETLVVTVFVVSLFIIIYQATVPTLGELDQQNRYDDIDSVYYANLYKQMLTRYANIQIIDGYLSNPSNNYYMDITDCDMKVDGAYLYNNRDYCKMIQKSINVSENDKIFITDYNISNFREKAKTLDYFNSEALSNFRTYIDTVPDVEHFYSRKKADSDLDGKYRLFLVREINETDSSITRRYANIGVYAGKYERYLQGELVHFNPGDGEKAFYVLKNSSSVSPTITLILANNLDSAGTPYFNCTGKFVVPDQEHSPLIPAYRTNVGLDDSCATVDVPRIINEVNSPSLTRITEYAHSVDNTNTVLVNLKNATSSWTNVSPLDKTTYTASAGYTINYTGYNARLLDENDILEVLGCGTDSTTCFNKDSDFSVGFDVIRLSYLVSGLNATNAYWTAVAIKDSNLYAWTIRNGEIKSTPISDHTNVGVRPVIIVNKNSSYLRRG